jgi:periplasmic protein TonB
MSTLQRLPREPSSKSVPLAGMDPRSRALAIAVSASVVLHGVALSIQFQFPHGHKPAPAQLDVVLVNSKTRSAPLKPDAYAQANLDAGGNTDQRRRAKTPIPALPEAERGRDFEQAARQVHELEARQRQLLSQLDARTKIPVQDMNPHERPEPEPRLTGIELASGALMIAHMEAQIARSIEEYNQRPRRQFIGARAAEARFALYVEHWRQKVEQIGNLNYPEGARGRIYGSLRLTVSINADGSVAGVDLDRSSGYKILDAAAERIVNLAAPYAKFPADIRKDTDILVITRTWHFAPGDRVFSD